ncbi:hypothetical protein CDAR_367911 [Caerostris darwini]|uniref:Uncharacterized protein n=1 Tax=Caerostris darwini TaxID=1538125 RepID=A0AAV4VVW0_9ARAC|nr:hypothetical protein CDAR_367911 [Caerostris darwini]
MKSRYGITGCLQKDCTNRKGKFCLLLFESPSIPHLTCCHPMECLPRIPLSGEVCARTDPDSEHSSTSHSSTSSSGVRTSWATCSAARRKVSSTSNVLGRLHEHCSFFFFF